MSNQKRGYVSDEKALPDPEDKIIVEKLKDGTYTRQEE